MGERKFYIMLSIVVLTVVVKYAPSALAFILPQNAIWGNQAPQERPGKYYQQPQPNDRGRYDRYSSTRQERRQNKTYYSQPDNNYPRRVERYYYNY